MWKEMENRETNKVLVVKAERKKREEKREDFRKLTVK